MLQTAGIQQGVPLEPLAGFFFAAGTVIISTHGGDEGAVRRMGGGGLQGQGIKARPVDLENFGVQGTGKVTQVHTLALGLHVFRREEGFQGLEIVRIPAHMAVYFGFAQDGRDIAAVQRQGFFIAGQGQGILVIREVIVSQHGQDGGNGVLLVELFQEGGTLVLLAHSCINVVSGADDFFRETALLLHLIQGSEGLFVLLVLEIEVQKVVMGSLVVREILYHRLIEFDTLQGLVLENLQTGLQAAVPVVGAVQGHGLLTGLGGGFQVCIPHRRKGQVVPDGVVARLGYGKGMQQLARLLVSSVGIKSNRVHQIGVRFLGGNGECAQAHKGEAY